MTRSIYTDIETENVIKEIKKRDDNFNLSEFIKECLLKFSGNAAVDNLDIDFLKKRLVTLKYKKQEIESEIEHYQSLVYQAEVKKEKMIEEQKQKEEEMKNKEEERIKAFADNILDNFTVSKKEARKLAKEYKIEFDRTKKSIFEFMEKKNYEMKDDK